MKKKTKSILIATSLSLIVAAMVHVSYPLVNHEYFCSAEKTTDCYVNQISKIALTAYRIDMEEYPSTKEGIEALFEAPKGKENKWRGPYLEEMPKDPWGNDYQYRYPGKINTEVYDLFSLGPDGEQSDDDITI